MLCSFPSNRFFSGPPRGEACARAAAFWYVAALRRAAEWILGVAAGLAVAVLIMHLIGIFTREANTCGPSHQCEGTERRTVNANRLIVALVAAVTLTLFMAAAGAQQLAAPQPSAPQPAAEQDGDPADAFFDRIEAEEEAAEAEEEGEEAEAKEEAAEERKEARKEAREEAVEAAEEKAEEAAEEGD